MLFVVVVDGVVVVGGGRVVVVVVGGGVVVIGGRGGGGGGGAPMQANGKVYDAPEYRYILSFRATDHTGSTFVTAFNEQAVEIMGCTAGELKRLQESDKDAYEAKFQQALFKELVLTLRCKADTYKDETRVRVGVQRCNHVNYVSESQHIITALKALLE